MLHNFLLGVNLRKSFRPWDKEGGGLQSGPIARDRRDRNVIAVIEKSKPKTAQAGVPVPHESRSDGSFTAEGRLGHTDI